MTERLDVVVLGVIGSYANSKARLVDMSAKALRYAVKSNCPSLFVQFYQQEVSFVCPEHGYVRVHSLYLAEI